MEYVTIGCRLPQGLLLEVGYSVTAKISNGGTVPQVTKHENYAAFELLGTNATFRKTRLRMPATMSPEPHINRNVPKDLWEEWVRNHKGSPLLKNGDIFVVEHDNQAESVQAQIVDSQGRPLMFSPLDASKKTKVTGGNEIETAKFED